MAKIIAAEKLKLDDIEMQQTGNKLVFNSLTQADENDVTSIDTRVSTEESTRGSADTSLTAADTSLTTRISTEESTHAAEEASLTTRVSTEESTRGSADTSLTAADTSLTTRVSTEESTRSSADTSLNTRMTAEELTTQVSTFTIGNGANYLTIDYSAFGYGASDVVKVAASMKNIKADSLDAWAAGSYSENNEVKHLGLPWKANTATSGIPGTSGDWDDNSDPILLAQMASSPTYQEATFVFSDAAPTANYRLDVIVSS